MNNVEFLKVYAENFANCAYEKAITKELEERLPVLHECNVVLGESINDHAYEEFDAAISRYHSFAKDLCKTIDAYYAFIENFTKENNLDENFIFEVGKKNYDIILPKFAKYTHEMEAIWGF